MHYYILQIKGMTCGGCAASVQRKLEARSEIDSCEVNFATESARIGSQKTLHPKQIIDWIRTIGFSVQTQHQMFRGFGDQFNENDLIPLLETDPHVIQFQVNPQLKSLDFTTLPDVNTSALNQALKERGFIDVTTKNHNAPTDDQNDDLGVWVSACLASPLVMQMIAMWLGWNWHLPVSLQWALATPIQLYFGRRFYQGALATLKRGEANMDTLVALGTSVAYGYSLYQWVTLGSAATDHLYFEASAVVITLVLLGKTIENRAKQSARSALSSLFALRPKTVTCLRRGKEVELDLSEINSGDVLVVRAGERIGVDGVVIKGEADIDASAMTGESLPEYRATGDSVISGTLLLDGTIRVSAERVGEASTVSQVTELVKNAQMGKATIQRLVDRISRVFVPVVLILSAVTFIGWVTFGTEIDYAVGAAISVLVIACPCALGLATPTALVAGTGLIATKGILIKDIETLESLPEVEVVAFDKTGTLTQGEPKVTRIQSLNTHPEEFIRYLVQVARESTHPLAQSIVRNLDKSSIPAVIVEEAITSPGRGISAMIKGVTYRLGQLNFVTDDATDVAIMGQSTTSYLSQNGKVLGHVEFSDTTRAEARLVVNALKLDNKRTIILTGDNEQIANALGSELAVDQVHSRLTPNQKIDVIGSYQSQGQRIAMVGDGINDGPALARADVGIAMGSGSEIALKSAPVVLMRPDLRLIPEAIHYARKTRHVIRQNLFWAFGYNVLCIPLAMSGLLTPSIAGAAMALSSVSVVVNALRLKYSA
ncbi:MAG: heavy metal translocating P-type ATPase [Pseudomonadota bacterium]|nr:heavy metal translocating P-type ATPase [Pseudomonadota bacterium]MEC9076969.1 heavy metal translocating P-type ATPase [Pseudomonadota bacterium]